MLLGAIGILDDNEDVLEAVMDDLQAVQGREGLTKASKQQADDLLTKMAQLQVSSLSPPFHLDSLKKTYLVK